MHSIEYLTVILLCIIQIISSHAGTELDLIQHLQNNYSPQARPVKSQKDVINVTFGFELISIISVTEMSQTLKMKIWIRMSWKNEFLSWDPKSYDNIKTTRLFPSEVWTPDLYLMENIHEDISSGPEKYKTHVQVFHDGIQRWNIPSIAQTSCPLDVTNFPFDNQNCTLKFISWSYDKTELDIIIDTRAILTSENYIPSPSWSLHHVSNKLVYQKYACCPNPYVHIEYAILLHREPRYYFYNIVLPCMIQMLIILFTFFLPPDSGERIGVAITVLLVFAVYLEVLNTNIPRTSLSSPALSRFYLTAMSGSAFSIMATCFVLVIHFKGAETGIGPMPKWVKKNLLDKLGVCLFVTKNMRTHNDEDLLALEKRGSCGEVLKSVNNGIYHPKNNNIVKNNVTSAEANLQRLVKEVKVITSLISDQNLQDEIEEEWQSLAKVFDRLFFILFAMFFVISSLVILYPVYHAHSSDSDTILL